MGALMSSRERLLAALRMTELPDRVPCVPMLMTRGIREGGIACDVAQRDPQAMAAAKMRAVERFGGDAILAGTDLFLSVENLGAELDYLPYAQPSLVRHPCPGRDSFHRLRDEARRRGFDPARGRVAAVAEEIRIFVRKGWKSHHLIVAPAGGPITTAQLLTGSGELLASLEEDPAYVRELIALALENVKSVCTVLLEAGADAINVLDPFCSCDVIPPEAYREFALPAQKELMAHIASLGGIGILHACTFIQPIWRDLASTGCQAVHGDFYPGMDHAKRAIGGEVCLMGAVSPFSTLLDGSPEEVRQEVRKLTVEAGYNGGFVCMPGCDLDWNVPAANLRAMIETCAEIRYPLDVAALGDLRGVFLPGHPKHRSRRPAPAEAKDSAVPIGRMGGPGGDSLRTPDQEIYFQLADAILSYDGEQAVYWTRKGLERGLSATQIVFEGLAAGMKRVGDLYERNERFVTDMLRAAKTMDKAMELLTPQLERSGRRGSAGGTVVMGLVRGNTQDIGKNLVSLMLRANGFRVVDLGKNVLPEAFVAAAAQAGAVAIGMSVMTNSSAVYVERVVELLRQQGRQGDYLVMCGGAGATRAMAERLGIAYGSDAGKAVALVRERAERRRPRAVRRPKSAAVLSLRAPGPR